MLQWFSYRKANRERPIIGERRLPSPLGAIQPDHWLAEYTTELINVLNVLGWLVDLEQIQANCWTEFAQGLRFHRMTYASQEHWTFPLNRKKEPTRKLGQIFSTMLTREPTIGNSRTSKPTRWNACCTLGACARVIRYVCGWPWSGGIKLIGRPMRFRRASTR